MFLSLSFSGSVPVSVSVLGVFSVDCCELLVLMLASSLSFSLSRPFPLSIPCSFLFCFRTGLPEISSLGPSVGLITVLFRAVVGWLVRLASN